MQTSTTFGDETITIGDTEYVVPAVIANLIEMQAKMIDDLQKIIDGK